MEFYTRSVSLLSDRTDAHGRHVCLICQEPIDLDGLEALQLQCACRGDLALRHRVCATQWVTIKGSNSCEVCGEEIANIEAPVAGMDLPESSAAAAAVLRQRDALMKCAIQQYRRPTLVKRVLRRMGRFVCCFMPRG